MPKQRLDETTKNTDLLKKLLMLELFRYGVSQQDIAKKLQLQTVTVNAFLKGIKKPK